MRKQPIGISKQKFITKILNFFFFCFFYLLFTFLQNKYKYLKLHLKKGKQMKYFLYVTSRKSVFIFSANVRIKDPTIYFFVLKQSGNKVKSHSLCLHKKLFAMVTKLFVFSYRNPHIFAGMKNLHVSSNS